MLDSKVLFVWKGSQEEVRTFTSVSAVARRSCWMHTLIITAGRRVGVGQTLDSRSLLTWDNAAEEDEAQWLQECLIVASACLWWKSWILCILRSDIAFSDFKVSVCVCVCANKLPQWQQKHSECVATTNDYTTNVLQSHDLMWVLVPAATLTAASWQSARGLSVWLSCLLCAGIYDSCIRKWQKVTVRGWNYLHARGLVHVFQIG